MSPTRTTAPSRVAASISTASPGRMAGGVIHLFEPVEVTEQDGDLAAFPGRTGQGGLQAVEEQGAIRQSGKGVVQGTVRQLLLGQHDVG